MGGVGEKDNGAPKLRQLSSSFSHPLSLHLHHRTFPQSHFLPTSNDLFPPPWTRALLHMRAQCLSRPVCSLSQKEPGWKAGGRTKPLLLYCRLQRKLKEGIVARRKPRHYISPCRQNNECINAKKHAMTHLLHFCAHSYLYLHLHVHPVDAFTRRPPTEPVKEWEADKVGQRSSFCGRALFGVCRVPQLPQERGCFFSYLDTQTFPFILLPFQWCVSSACAAKSMFALPVIFFLFLCVSGGTCLIIPP